MPAYRERVYRGFTLMEMVVVLLLLGILSIYATPRILNLAESTMDSQAKAFASDLRRVQLLASVRGATLCVCLINNQSYKVLNSSCNPDDANAVTDPSTGKVFQSQLVNGVIFLQGPTLLKFDSSGQPDAGAAYAIGKDSNTPAIQVQVTSLTGYVTTGPAP